MIIFQVCVSRPTTHVNHRKDFIRTDPVTFREGMGDAAKFIRSRSGLCLYHGPSFLYFFSNSGFGVESNFHHLPASGVPASFKKFGR